MRDRSPAPSSPEEEVARQRLEELRLALLRLHKTLIDSERLSYETTVGATPSPTQFLRLLIGDPSFAWLQPWSRLIVAMDEALEEEGPLTRDGVDTLVRRASLLLVASGEGDECSGPYFVALQRDPDVVLAHAAVSRLIRPRDRGA